MSRTEVTGSLGVYAERLAAERELFGQLSVEQLEELARDSEALVAKARLMAESHRVMPLSATLPGTVMNQERTYRCTGFKGRCGNTYIRQEALADLLGTTLDAIRIPAEVAAGLEEALRTSEALAETDRKNTRDRLEKHRRAFIAKLGRGYDDYPEGRISKDFWTRKSEQWEDERRSLETQLARLNQPATPMALTAQKILELAKQAGFLYRKQDPAEQRRLIETVLSNCAFDRGSLCPPTLSRSISSRGRTKQGIGGEGGIRTPVRY